MLNYIKELSLGRSAWFLLILSGVILEGIALYFQHKMGLAPCVMCIYERIALLAICIAGAIAFIAPRFLLFRLTALAMGILGAIQGLNLSVKHYNYQFNPSPWNQCPIKVDFPDQFPLNQWFPNFFEATGSCSEIKWQFLSFSMPQWLAMIFSAYLTVLVIVALSQFKRLKKKDQFIFG
ncbi:MULTISPECIES: disulfide bond formation protein DsbB [Pasteurellaceae]|uniref:Disulfide bond formation protein B n=1 Tax=Pasteurella atlantica TaxID=2827233 RepID=A0AAW8CMC2_9PAST|nr:disulfide bond formation protein DsbB [Pasteurella atlantica]MBR0572800.1 disulfide bond formation protein DsbB [Pasteurella atlantica]MDP8038728.1 disulfide bond formation protein DsbB [Pasteurella atlantica]MDP8040820.1 disulfide bond formation protein DsbB [Pasteurella atlantica]MDP8043007.1 disulfide bond formation protein DsbB [Pasteurella atlantica]MDP8045093.1 disulfide bond formation protein DsbB [Pasteurella atlantica]